MRISWQSDDNDERNYILLAKIYCATDNEGRKRPKRSDFSRIFSPIFHNRSFVNLTLNERGTRDFT